MTSKNARFLADLERLVDAACALAATWERDSPDVQGYPPGLPCFDEHVGALIAWRDAMRAKSEETP